jgi:hypothetical protein
MLDTNWQKLYEAAILEINPDDKLVTLIEAAERAIAQRESLVDITEIEHRKLADARSMLKSLSRGFVRETDRISGVAATTGTIRLRDFQPRHLPFSQNLQNAGVPIVVFGPLLCGHADENRIGQGLRLLIGKIREFSRMFLG